MSIQSSIGIQAAFVGSCQSPPARASSICDPSPAAVAYAMQGLRPRPPSGQPSSGITKRVAASLGAGHIEAALDAAAVEFTDGERLGVRLRAAR